MTKSCILSAMSCCLRLSFSSLMASIRPKDISRARLPCRPFSTSFSARSSAFTDCRDSSCSACCCSCASTDSGSRAKGSGDDDGDVRDEAELREEGVVEAGAL